VRRKVKGLSLPGYELADRMFFRSTVGEEEAGCDYRKEKKSLFLESTQGAEVTTEDKQSKRSEASDS
jgi:hypothetical protein